MLHIKAVIVAMYFVVRKGFTTVATSNKLGNLLSKPRSTQGKSQDQHDEK